jgi:UDPglucose--hexose-1-phosphate uridylyltransferase
MADFRFLEIKEGKWIVSAPKRAKRPNQAKGTAIECPFEPGIEKPIFQIGEVRVINNKYPFAPVHEVIIHSDDHRKNFDELTLSQNFDIFQVFKERFAKHADKGQVFIFHNQGKNGGESLPHPHTQLVVVPKEVQLDTPSLSRRHEEVKELPFFNIFCPDLSQWPDEVWIEPRHSGYFFHEAGEHELKEIAFILGRLVEIFTLRHGHDFPFNFYIYPGKNWYLRLVPRVKILGGFEIGTGIVVNTQLPQETFEFIKEHFDNPDYEKIKNLQQAEYQKSV